MYRMIFGLVIMVLCGTLNYSMDVYGQVRKIIGSNADVTPPPPPIGCGPASTFNLVAGSTVATYSTGGASVGHSFVVTPNYANYIGAAFQSARDTTGAEAFIGAVTFRGSPATFTSSIEWTTANVPMVSNTYAIVADVQNSRVLLHGTRASAPCNVTNCLQLQLYNTSDTAVGLVADVTTGIGAAQGSLGGISDSNYYYFLQRNTASSASVVYQYTKDTSLTLVNSASIGNFSPAVMTDDGTNLLVMNTIAPAVLRINKTTLAVTSLTITGASGTATDELTYDGTNNHYYIATTNAGVTTLRQINATTGAATGVTQSLGTETLLQYGLQADVTAGKLYAATDVTGTTTRIRRYALNTMTPEQTQSSVIGQPTTNAAQDFIHKRFWFSGAGSPGVVQPYTLCS